MWRWTRLAWPISPASSSLSSACMPPRLFSKAASVILVKAPSSSARIADRVPAPRSAVWTMRSSAVTAGTFLTVEVPLATHLDTGCECVDVIGGGVVRLGPERCERLPAGEDGRRVVVREALGRLGRGAERARRADQRLVAVDRDVADLAVLHRLLVAGPYSGHVLLAFGLNARLGVQANVDVPFCGGCRNHAGNGRAGRIIAGRYMRRALDRHAR